MRSLIWASSVVAGAALISAAACGGDATVTGSGGSGGTGATGGGGSTSSTGASGGSGGSGGSTASTGGGGTAGTGGSGGMFVPMCVDTPSDTIFAIDTLKFGANNSTAWKTLGLDIDGLDSMGDCTGQCTLSAQGSPSKECTDGANGIDNSFGQVIVPFLKANTVNIDDQANTAIQMGEFTVLLDFVNLTAGADQASVVMNMYNGGGLGSAPKFDGTDCWPVTPESLKDKTDITSAKASFKMTQIAANHVATGVIDVLRLSLATDIGEIFLNVHAARLEFDLSAAHDAAILGTVSGVLDKDEFTDTIQGAIYQRFGPSLGKTLCHEGDTTIEGAVDIMDDGSADPSMACNGISFGIGFTAKPVKFGGIQPSTPPTTNACPPM